MARYSHLWAGYSGAPMLTWFNLGSNLTVLGDIPNAVKAFDTARSLELPSDILRSGRTHGICGYAGAIYGAIGPVCGYPRAVCG